MRTKAVIFDKDGTLLDFDAFWVTMSYYAIEEMLQRLEIKEDLTEEILKGFGIENGITDINGVICYGTYEMMADIMQEILKGYGYDFTAKEIFEVSVDCYHKNSDKGIIKPPCEDIRGVLKQLKDAGVVLAVVTSDDEFGAKKCFKTLGIEDMFDYIYANDGKTPVKPDPFYIHDLCRKTGFSKDELVMVGDTMTDVEFARNAGVYMIGVAKEEKNKETLRPVVDCVTEDISGVYGIISVI